MIIAGLYQTYGKMDLNEVRARDLFNIFIPNMSKDTVIMNIARIRKTPTKKLSPEEAKIKRQFRIRNQQPTGSASDLFAVLAGLAKKR